MSAAAFAVQLESKVRPDILARLSEEIARVEEELERSIASDVGLVRQASRHTLCAGGKRLRPALVTLAADATGRPFEPVRTRRLGAAMEMIHMATLMHDDVIDRASLRRGIETASAKFGSTASILTGDVLLSKAMLILAEDGDLSIIRNVARAVVDLAEGEVQELEARGRIDIAKEEHFEILRRKTAAFIACCCQVGALAAGAPEPEVRALGEYGAGVGMAFQIADDRLDFASDPTLTGKPNGTDFSEGCATLPIILLMPRLDSGDRARLEALFGTSPTEAERSWLHEVLHAAGTLDEVDAHAARYMGQALRALDALPASSARDLLAAVAEFVVWRKA